MRLTQEGAQIVLAQAQEQIAAHDYRFVTDARIMEALLEYYLKQSGVEKAWDNYVAARKAFEDKPWLPGKS